MSYVVDYIKALKTGISLQLPNCPDCSSELQVIVFGLPSKELQILANEERSKIILGGCCCYGDDRDDVFYCPMCKKGFNEKQERNELIPCPLEASNRIRANECRNYDLLKQKYTLLDDKEKICNLICPLVGRYVKVQTTDNKVNSGRLWRTFSYTISSPGNTIELVKTTTKYHAEYISIFIKDIVSISEDFDKKWY